MTDAELRRALDYSVGDIVMFFKSRNNHPIGVIEGIRLTQNQENIMYVVRYATGKGIKFVLARADEIKFIKHGDEETNKN